MFHRENRQAAHQIVDTLRNALSSSTADLNDLRTSFDQSGVGTAADAMAIAKKTAVEVEQLRTQVSPLYTLMRQTPRAQELITAVFKELETIEEVFTRYQHFAHEKYGIEPLNVSECDSAQEKKIEPPSSHVDEVAQVSTISVAQRVGSRSFVNSYTPASNKVSKRLDIPVTPRLEDFGLRDEDIRALATSTPGTVNKENQGYVGIAAKYSTSIARNAGIEIDEDEYETMVLNSMSALGIETPKQLEQRFATKRNVALKEVLQTTTPKVKAGSSERTLDYTNLANGYFESSKKGAGDRLHRTLNFGETPEPRSGALRHIVEAYDELDHFWRGTFDFDTIQDVCVALSRTGQEEFSKEVFLETLRHYVDVHRCETLAVVLAKMKVLSVHKVHGTNAVYRFLGLHNAS
eukprot:TRINITY_DN40771_c0_g1_i1.p1 TRINITY_DN40771_c0_g1~~TRINITY_DN40771_c0_g1_i1.p1  ORF type:complete len:406 (-),score=78.49 TRINITY_DN40771_c0_g1_i1:282-1499(-)